MTSPVDTAHPAFLAILRSRTDKATGLHVARVRYAKTHPDYGGGDFTEVFDEHGDCLCHDFKTENLDLALAEAIDEYGDELDEYGDET